MDNKTLKTWNTMSTTQLSNFLDNNSKTFICGSILNIPEVTDQVSKISNIALEYSTFIPKYLAGKSNSSYIDYQSSLSSKVYLVHKDLIYSNDNILNIIKVDFPNFILLDLTNVTISNIDNLIYKYELRLNNLFKDRYIDSDKQDLGKYTEINNMVTSNHTNIEKNIREAIYKDHLILIPLYRNNNRYKSNMFSKCVTYYDFKSIQDSKANSTFINYLGLQIPLILNKDAKIAYACINKKTSISIENTITNVQQLIATILFILGNKSTQLNKVKESIINYIDRINGNEDVVDLIYTIIA